MTASPNPTPQELFRATLAGEGTDALRLRRFFRHLPADPRCKACNAPFGLPGSIVSRVMGRPRWAKNPRFCSRCYTFLREAGIGGAEVVVTMLFADVRGSTGLAEELGPSEFTDRINRFYRVATRALIETDGMVDKLVGDGVVGLYVPGLSGMDHAARAIQAARRIAATGTEPEGHGLPVGVGVHTGVAFIGAVGERGGVDDFTALGDTPNTAARLGSDAKAGQILVSEAAATAGGLQRAGHERRHLTLKGRSEPIDVVVLAPGEA